ncbi:alpha-1,6-mannosyl-glycoprotein 2-beta-N-acetylglucosaminyltransferase isoform X2 [Spodoptera frugiperda]|uniref:Alpha-1,6-mannosyl-glycoprotein 2-beta-N-acetylglucosaminyltransferase n=1 Tax=Spodoptera frugiperda TaxID=7108 RepID=A0A9R0DZI3_SPOFR|nr:alpha-1,6-mannosyl-glycoprotein 2-beta-N-acetylglucosaminyltransferase isoform X2 [Spodoptera frugiperda]
MPRLKYASVARVVVILGLFCLWLQIMLSASTGGMYRDGGEDNSIQMQWALFKIKPNRSEELMNANDTSEQVLALVPPELHKYLTVHPRNNSGNTTDRIAVKNITEIKQAIKRYNDAQTIYNEDIFGAVQNDTVIIAIQVHTRLTYLRHLIVSLAQAKEIDRTLLIFSHDYYDEEINNLVRSIDFTKVMQIFYPYSIQTHPHEFPGMDPNDCPRDTKFEQAVKLECNNALYPDLHGHYREAKYTQTKHHWWWKANRIFNQLQCTAGHTGYVLFLEEDHYVAEDFLHILNLLKSTADKSCPQCEMLSLGTYLKTYQYHVNGDKRKKNMNLNYIQQVKLANEERRKKHENNPTWNFQVYPHLYTATQKVEITPWHSSMHNMGFAFNRTVWNHIMKQQSQFCAYDDYNWDYSLLHLSQNMPGREKFKVIVCKGPRVFHIGECGFHHKKSNCNASTVISKVQKLLQNAKPYLYPTRVSAQVTAGGAKHNKKLVKGNGGWGDIRDQELCTNMTKVGRQHRHTIFYA